MIGCLDLDADGMSRAELSQHLLDLEALRTRLDAVCVRATAAWDALQVWADDGARTGTAWLRQHTGMSSRRASAQVRTARALRAMPRTEAAFDDGSLSFEKVQLLTSARTEFTSPAFDDQEAVLVARARELTADDLATYLRVWKAWADAAGFANDAQAMLDSRHASVSDTLDGMVKIDGWLDPESGRIFQQVFDDIDRELARQDRRDKANAIGAPVRTAAQRHADALTEMARRAASTNPDTARRPRPEVIVHLDWHTLLAQTGARGPARSDGDEADAGSTTDGSCDADPADASPRSGTDVAAIGNGSLPTGVRRGVAFFDNGRPVTGDAARRLACDAGVVRVITNGPSEILDLGRLTATVAAAQRRALAMRDGGCTFAGCDMPASCCDAHHVIAYRRGRATGGPTNLDDLALLCPRHHHLVHEGGFTVARDPITGRIDTRRPDGTLIPNPPRVTPLTLFADLDRANPSDRDVA